MHRRTAYLSEFSGRGEELYQMALSSLKENKNNTFYYILPNGNIINKYRNRFTKDLGVTRKVNLFTFDDVVLDIVGEKKILNDELRNIIIYKVVEKLSKDNTLSAFKNYHMMDGFISSMAKIIGIVKRSLLRSVDFKASNLDIKYFKEIALIYEAYENYLFKNKLYDREEIYFLAIEKLDQERLEDSLEYIVIDEFYDFRPIEIHLLRSLVKSDIDIFINIPYNLKDFKLIEETKDLMAELEFAMEEVEGEIDSEFKGLALSIFQEEKSTRPEKVKIISGPEIDLELKGIFKDIKSEFKKGIKLEQMVIVAVNDSYREEIIKQAVKEALPLNVDISKSLLEYPLVMEILDLIKLKNRENFRHKLLKRLSSSYFPIYEGEDLKKIYSNLRRMNFNSLEELKSKFSIGSELKIETDILRSIYEIIDRMEREIEDLEEIVTINGYLTYLEEKLKEYEIKKELVSEGDIFKLRENIEVLKAIENVGEELGEISEIMDQISFEHFFQILIDLCQSQEIVIYPKKRTGIRLESVINLRGLSFKNVYIPGMTQSIYPKGPVRDFFIKEENSEDLRNLGLDLMSYEEELENEIIKFKILLASVENSLVMSYSSGLEGENLASIFIDEIRRILGNCEEETIGYDNIIALDSSYILNKRDLEGFILKNIDLSPCELGYYNKLYPGELEEFYRRHKIEQMRQELGNNYMGKISSPSIIREIEGRNKNRIYSSSYLEDYAKCHFKFMLDRLYGLEDIYEEIRDKDPLKLGNLYHLSLRDFYERYKDQLDSLDHEAGLNFLENRYRLNAIELGIELTKPSIRLILDLNYRRLRDFVLDDLARLKKYSLRPIALEKKFGFEKDFKIGAYYFAGIIDRIDQDPNGQLLVMDYKSGSYGINGVKEIKDGLAFQMPIYILAQEDEKLVDGIYGNIRYKSFHAGLVQEGSRSGYRDRKNIVDREEFKKILGIARENIKEVIEGINSGDFTIDPKECSSYCPYRSICRYEEKVTIDD